MAAGAGRPAATAALALTEGGASNSVFWSRNQPGSRPNTPASMSSISAEGMRLPVSTIDR